jgi:hypothetical protein
VEVRLGKPALAGVSEAGTELGHPPLRELARDGSPVYAWAYADRRYWMLAPEPFPMRALRLATAPRDRP